jgi:hypothetical protein
MRFSTTRRAAAVMAGGVVAVLIGSLLWAAEAASGADEKPARKPSVPSVFDRIVCGDAAAKPGKKAGQWIAIAADGKFEAHLPGVGEKKGDLTAAELTELKGLVRAVDWRTIKADYGPLDKPVALGRLMISVGNKPHATGVADKASAKMPASLQALLRDLNDLLRRHVGAATLADKSDGSAGSGDKSKSSAQTGGKKSSSSSGSSGLFSGGGSLPSYGKSGSSGGGGGYYVPLPPGGGGGSGSGASAPLAVLFIGNSYTSVNDLPHLVAGLAQASGRKLDVAQVTPGGCTLEQHVQTSGAMQQIRARKWDVVVLQEQSQLPVVKPEMMYAAARQLDAEIQKQKSKTVFYLTWARQNNPKMQDGLNKAYFTIAKELGATVAPVGIAWQKALAADPALVLHTSDGSHPNAAGSYLAACLFYATILHKSPEGLPAEIKLDGKLLLSVPPATAKALQAAAAKAMQGG